MTGCGCLAVVAALAALLVIFIRGSFDAGEPIEQAIALVPVALVAVALAFELGQGKRTARDLVRPGGA